MAGLPRKAFINSLSNCLREYPQLNGRESVVVHRIEELYQSGMERHAALAVDDRASTHLQLVWFKGHIKPCFHGSRTTTRRSWKL